MGRFPRFHFDTAYLPKDEQFDARRAALSVYDPSLADGSDSDSFRAYRRMDAR
jgi:hypothetical protein